MIEAILGLTMSASISIAGANFTNNLSDSLNYSNYSIITEKRDASDFKTIKVSSDVNVEIRTAEDFSITLDGTPEAVANIETEIENRALDIRAIKNLNGKTNNEVKVTVNVPQDMLEEVTVTAAGTVACYDKIRAFDFTVKTNNGGSVSFTDIEVENEFVAILSGGSTIEFKGTAPTSKILVNGSGWVNCSDLSTTTTEVTVNGNGKAEVKAGDEILATVVDGGRIEYFGTPKTLLKSCNGGIIKQKED